MVPCAQGGQRARSTPVSRRRSVRQSLGGRGVVGGGAPPRRRPARASAVGTWRAANRPKCRIFTKPRGKTWSKKRRRNSRGGRGDAAAILGGEANGVGGEGLEAVIGEPDAVS